MNNLCFPHKMGKDCVTSSLRNYLAFYGIELTESMVFGLGEGLFFWYADLPKTQFPVLLGQNLAIEDAICNRLEMELILHQPTTDKEAEDVFSHLPSIVKADPYYLDYCWRDNSNREHFGEHVLLVVDIYKDKVMISDIWSEKLEVISKNMLSIARSSKIGYEFLLPKNRWYEIKVPKNIVNWKDKIPSAIALTVENMLNAQGNFGISGLNKAALDMNKWIDSINPKFLKKSSIIIAQRMDDGGVGSCFREMFVEFLKESAHILSFPKLISIANSFERKVIPQWRSIIKLLREISIKDKKKYKNDITIKLKKIANLEEKLCLKLKEEIKIFL